MAEELGIVLPPGVERPLPPTPERGMIVNETDLPDVVVQRAVETFFEENASVLGANSATTFQSYSSEGSLLARSKFRTPTNVIDEIVLSRDLAERDDDVGATMGSMLAAAFSEGMENQHEDDITVSLFNEIARNADLDRVFCDLYRELLIAASVTTVSAFTREDFQFQPAGAERQRTRGVVAPVIGVLPAELIRVVDNDLFGTGTLAYRPATGSQEKWLEEFFDVGTSPARKAEMRAQDPVLTTMVVEKLPNADSERPTYVTETADQAYGNDLYRLNPRMVHRSTFPKGAWKYPRPLLTRDFALLEAKRLLNLMDYALLQGAANFLIVAKKGSDQRPAVPEEITNLRDQIARASRSGVIIGDHRLNIEIITPDMKELLNADKRKLLGRKISKGLLRLPEYADANDAGSQAVLSDVEMLARVISGDRRLLKRHVERHVYGEAVRRNPGHFQFGAAQVWFPKIVLQGLQYFTDLVLKLRDRGDISRKSAVEAGGFSYEAEREQRRREKKNGDDDVLTPPPVPFDGAGPQDNNSGRPAGTSSDNGSGAASVQRSPAGSPRPSRQVTRNAGETVRAMYEEEHGSYRVGELTYAVLEEYADTREIGRLTGFETTSLHAIEDGDFTTRSEGPLTVVPVNPGYDVEEIRAIRLSPGLSMLLGKRISDQALVARAFCFRQPEFSGLDAQETAIRWGFPADPPPAPAPAPAELEERAGTQEIHLHVDGAQAMRVLRDDEGRITGTEPVTS